MTLFTIAIAATFVALAILSFLSPSLVLLGSWLPLHLLLAGAASTAIAGVMPFFSAAVSNAPPAATGVRLVGVLGVAVGACLLVVGRGFWPVGVSFAGAPIAGSSVAALGGLAYLLGLGGVAASTLLPLRFALGARRLFMGAVYGLALANAAVGVTVSTSLLLGWSPIVAAWGVLKPAHAWLNLFGFVSLVIAGSLLHLLPTVAGARINRTAASMACFAGLASGPPLAALGFTVRVDVLAMLGAALTVLGAGALAWHALAVMRSRARWTTDPSWHLFTTWSLVLGIVWFVGATVIATGQVLAGGASPAGWSLATLAVPIGVGWAAQVLVGAWSHLVPAVGPGNPVQHARQRALLGRLGGVRVLALNLGGLMAVAGHAAGIAALESLGLVIVLVTGAVAIVLLGTALAVVGRGQTRSEASD